MPQGEFAPSTLIVITANMSKVDTCAGRHLGRFGTVRTNGEEGDCDRRQTVEWICCYDALGGLNSFVPVFLGSIYSVGRVTPKCFRILQVV